MYRNRSEIVPYKKLQTNVREPFHKKYKFKLIFTNYLLAVVQGYATYIVDI